MPRRPRVFVEGLTYQVYKRVGSGSRPALTHIDRFSIVELNVRLRAVIGMGRQKFGGGPGSGEVPEVMGGPAAVTRPPTGSGLRYGALTASPKSRVGRANGRTCPASNSTTPPGG